MGLCSYVQNIILNKHFTDIYYDLDLSSENYWNHEYHTETIDRITIEDYMNIHFYTNDDYKKLLNLLIAKSQMGFIELIVKPLFDVLSICILGLK